MHRAPVVGIVVLDGHGAPLPEPLEVAHDLARSPDMHGSHHLLVISEEQFKVRITHCQRPSHTTQTPVNSYTYDTQNLYRCSRLRFHLMFTHLNYDAFATDVGFIALY